MIRRLLFRIQQLARHYIVRERECNALSPWGSRCLRPEGHNARPCLDLNGNTWRSR